MENKFNPGDYVIPAVTDQFLKNRGDKMPLLHVVFYRVQEVFTQQCYGGKQVFLDLRMHKAEYSIDGMGMGSALITLTMIGPSVSTGNTNNVVRMTVPEVVLFDPMSLPRAYTKKKDVDGTVYTAQSPGT